MKKVLIVSPVPFSPDFEGNRKRVRQIVDLFMGGGFIVDFLNVLHDSGNVGMMKEIVNGDVYTLKDQKKATWFRIWKIKHRVSKLFKKYEWFNIHGDSWFFEKIRQEVILKQRINKYNIIICEYPIYSKLFDNPELTEVLKIIDTHDIFADRYKIFLKNGQRPQWFSISHQEEQRLLKRADLILAIQDHEKEYFSRKYGIKAITFPFLEQPPQREYISKLKSSATSDRLLNVVFIGSNNQINFSAANWIINNLVVPEILHAGVKFHFIGSVCMHINKRDGIILHGVIDHLDDILIYMDVLVNILHDASGLPIKVISSLSRGVLIMANNTGIRGIDDNLKNHGVYLSETKEDAKNTILKLANLSPSERSFMRMKTAEIYSEYFTLTNKKLISTINQFEKNDNIF